MEEGWSCRAYPLGDRKSLRDRMALSTPYKYEGTETLGARNTVMTERHLLPGLWNERVPKREGDLFPMFLGEQRVQAGPEHTGRAGPQPSGMGRAALLT